MKINRMAYEMEEWPTTHDYDDVGSHDELEQKFEFFKTWNSETRRSEMTVYRIERFLANKEDIDPSVDELSAGISRRIRRQYKLQRNADGLYEGNPSTIFQVFLEKFPRRTCAYTNFNDLWLGFVDNRRAWETVNS